MGNVITTVANGTILKSPGVCSPGLHRDVSPGQGLLVEFLATLILALVCCGVWDHRNSDKHDSVAIRFGLAIAVLAMAAVSNQRCSITQIILLHFQGPYTGANMNPARSFAPALYNGDWDNHWVKNSQKPICTTEKLLFFQLYWVGPLLAGFVGALIYRLLFAKDPQPKKEELPEGIALNDNNKA